MGWYERLTALGKVAHVLGTRSATLCATLEVTVTGRTHPVMGD